MLSVQRTARFTVALVGLAFSVNMLSAQTAVQLPGTQPIDGTGHPDFPMFSDGGVADGNLDHPSTCRACHGDVRQPGQPIYEPFDTWAGSMMAMSARDPLYWAATDIAIQDDDDYLGNVGIGDFCQKCHLPKGWLEGRSYCPQPWGEDYHSTCYEGDMRTPDNDFEGITCHFCHRMYDASDPPPGEFEDPNAPYAGNGRFFLSRNHYEMRGPFSDAQNSPYHSSVQSDLHTSGELCAVCHQVTHPLLEEVTDRGGSTGHAMPFERTWTEWQMSAFSDESSPSYATCVDCHMVPVDVDVDGDGTPDAVPVANLPGLLPRGPGSPLEGAAYSHFMAGGSVWMLEVLKGEYGGPDDLDREDQFDAAIAATYGILAQSVDLDLNAPASGAAGEATFFDVRVTNLTGHKFPTGYPEGRRAWVNVASGQDENEDGILQDSEVFYESAVYDEDSAFLHIVDTAVPLNQYIPKIYEPKYGVYGWDEFAEPWICDITDGLDEQKIFHAVLNDCIVQDNRIPPLGFVPNEETKVVRYSYAENPAMPGTLQNWDDSEYRVDVPNWADKPWIIRARVYYQSVSDEYIQFLRDQNRNGCDPFDAGCDPSDPDAPGLNRGEKLFQLWLDYGRCPPVEIASQQVTIPIQPRGSCCFGSSCVDMLPSDCADLAGDYLGDQDCDMSDCTPPVEPAPGEVSKMEAGGTPLLVTNYDKVLRNLTVSYDPACDASSHVLVWGDLEDVASYNYSNVDCSLDTSGEATFFASSRSRFFMVAGKNRSVEGSMGRDSAGTERPESSSGELCDYPQDLSGSCN